ncbi:hypothetical protein EDF68_104146 [Ochrobactrum sp. BH3]|nr:hypothetical protein EDF68_104146 [Ochrobactrum sp. BH3]
MPVFDEQLLDKLPAQCRAKIIRLDVERDTAYAATTVAADNLREARTDLSKAEFNLRREAENRYETNFDFRKKRSVDDFFKDLSDKLEPAKTRLAVAEQAHVAAVQNFTRFSFLENCRDWLTNHGREVLPYRPVYSERNDSVRSPGEEVAKIRKKIQKLDTELIGVLAAPLPKDELVQRAIAEIDAIASKGAITIRPTTRSHTPLRLADRLTISTTDRGGIVGDVGSFFTWLLRDAIVATISSEIEAMTFASSLSEESREAKLGELNAAKLELERAEEAVIQLAEKSGHAIPRRQEADPRAIFEVSA